MLIQKFLTLVWKSYFFAKRFILDVCWIQLYYFFILAKPNKLIRAFLVNILILWRCRSDIALNIAMTLLIYCKWNTWRCQFSISAWHQDLDIGPIRLLISSWHCHNDGCYLAERNPPGSCTTSVSATIMPHLYCDNWKLKLRVRFFSIAATKNLQNVFKQR